MSKATRYSLFSLAALLLAAAALLALVLGDEKEHSFYSSGGVVYFTQYLILSAGIFSLLFAVIATWNTWVQPARASSCLLSLLMHLPLMLLSTLLAYAGLLFLSLI